MTRATIIIGLLLLAGCAGAAGHASPAANDAPPAAATSQPRTITDLSQITPQAGIGLSMPHSLASRSAGAAGPASPNRRVQQNVEKFVIADLDQARYHEGRTPAPGEVKLLNAKARQFPDFSYQLLNQTLTAARGLEPKRLQGRELPNDIGELVLTAVMDGQGRLTEIVIDGHSGDRLVDHLLIDASKQGVWSRNPPAQALDSDGRYRVRLHGQIRAYSFDRNGHYHYRTTLGLEML